MNLGWLWLGCVSHPSDDDVDDDDDDDDDDDEGDGDDDNNDGGDDDDDDCHDTSIHIWFPSGSRYKIQRHWNPHLNSNKQKWKDRAQQGIIIITITISAW